jgi:hypothetical protein
MSGRAVVAASAVVALAAGGAFVNEVFVAEAIPSWGGSGSCSSSLSRDEVLFGFAQFANDTSMDITVLSAEPTASTGVEVVEILYIPWKNLQSGGLGTGYPGDPENERYDLTPLKRVVVEPGQQISLVAHLRSTDSFGAATNFALRYENGFGIPHTAMVSNKIGFAPVVDSEGDDDDDDLVTCDAVYDYEG